MLLALFIKDFLRKRYRISVFEALNLFIFFINSQKVVGSQAQ